MAKTDLSAQTIEEIKKQIAGQYPQMTDVHPTIEASQPVSQKAVASKLGIRAPKGPLARMYVLNFKKTVSAEDGTLLLSLVQATVNHQGQVLRTTASKRFAPQQRASEQ